eukprot:TRINITY_DN9736_c0_g1_i1.p1 TRINITY_DN9736_c0_g1~~TRINITY_DN9736_c0_g1_i1.p1  ORF type:complete len:463 (-),score=98.25 TRINITY_DN9736_c0_g1_i1:182-1570(-)
MQRYDRVRLLGRGSYGTAILVRVPLTGSEQSSRGDCASSLRVVKEVDLFGSEDKCRAEALREAELLKSLSHTNIIGYEDAFVSDKRLCIVMEFADGGDLWAAIARRRSSGRRYHEREAMAVFVQVVLALEHVHSHRILHRDIKSQNVFLTSAGVVKLGDFGIARVLKDSEECAETRVGTPHNLPPEICEDRPYDFKVDVWGLGVLLYEVLALEVPFHANSVAALVIKICTAEPKAIPAVYSSELRALLGRLLAKRAEDRPMASEVAALSHVQRGLAAMRPVTPALQGTCGTAGGRAAQLDLTRPPEEVSRAPTPMGSLKEEPAGCESPKRSRSKARLSLPLPGAVATSPLLVPRESTDEDEGAGASPKKKCRVSNSELREAGRILGVRPDIYLDPSPGSVSCGAEVIRLCRTATPRDAESWRSPILRMALGECSPGPIEMSATCTQLLSELEQELLAEVRLP